MNIVLCKSDELHPVVQPILQQLFARIWALLPGAELHHIGATSVPGAFTKGDIDILLRLPPDDFMVAVEVFKQHFQLKQPDNWTAEFASFGDDTKYALPVGLQVVVKDSENDFFLFLRDYFIENPEALHEYNRLKVVNSAGGEERYWNAKNDFLTRILAGRVSPPESGMLPTSPGVADVICPDEPFARLVYIGGTTKEQLRTQLKDAGVELNELAQILFASDRFITSETGAN